MKAKHKSKNNNWLILLAIGLLAAILAFGIWLGSRDSIDKECNDSRSTTFLDDLCTPPNS